ncbi:PIN domain-containing protein [Photobacterium leiognathi]|uniref:PIN domain-containing protein n=1 Tax=Photobacterium leiognathi TaxID=553611 RepID=UPI002981067D|nr:PIN domain-containing protein [Photobacterium leiognathi]
MSKEFNKKTIYPSPEKAFGFCLKPISEIKNDCLFVLDANVLLLPFTTDVKNLDAIRVVYQTLVEQDRLFLPSQAVREYLDNRAKKLSDINEALSKKATQNFNYVGSHPLLGGVEEYNALIEQEVILKEAIKTYQRKIRETLDAVQAWGWNDPVSKMYHEVLVERVLNDKDLDLTAISKDLERRNELNIPPGFKDKAKKENQAGDLLIWHELLKLASDKNCDLVFVSGDEKADWWHQSGKSPLYPRFELVDEFRERTNGKSFHIISLSKLLEIFETDTEVVEAVKTSEVEATVDNDVNIMSKPEKKVVTREADSEYREYLNIPSNHQLLVNRVQWKLKGGYDTDTYDLVELNEDGEVIEKYKLYDSTKTSPPFSRELHYTIA